MFFSNFNVYYVIIIVLLSVVVSVFVWYKTKTKLNLAENDQNGENVENVEETNTHWLDDTIYVLPHVKLNNESDQGYELDASNLRWVDGNTYQIGRAHV